jgi:Xaa-Pro aminopeptidase
MSLQEVREAIKGLKIDVYVLPRTDEHQSEYLCGEDERLAFLTGFTGSSGLAFISQIDAFVWTDSRYFLQAEAELK